MVGLSDNLKLPSQEYSRTPTSRGASVIPPPSTNKTEKSSTSDNFTVANTSTGSRSASEVREFITDQRWLNKNVFSIIEKKGIMIDSTKLERLSSIMYESKRVFYPRSDGTSELSYEEVRNNIKFIEPNPQKAKQLLQALRDTEDTSNSNLEPYYKGLEFINKKYPELKTEPLRVEQNSKGELFFQLPKEWGAGKSYKLNITLDELKAKGSVDLIMEGKVIGKLEMRTITLPNGEVLPNVVIATFK